MSRSSRHMACKTCRDRKVRCDGGQPSCEKCRRAGDKCIYVPTSTPTRADLAQTIAGLQERLAKAEAKILTQRSEVGGSAPAQYDQPMANAIFDATTLNDSPPFDLQFPSPTSMSSLHPCSLPCSSQSTSEFQSLVSTSQDEDMNWEVLRSILNSPPSLRIDFQPDKPEEHDDDSSRNFQLPTPNEIRALNNNAQLNNSCTLNANAPDENYKKIVGEFGDLLSTVFATEADIAGVSSAVADYLSWARKSPEKTDYSAVLQVLETRVRELSQLASTRYWAAFKHMRASFGRDACIQEQLRALETDLIDHNVKTMQFFHEYYDISLPLAEQQRD